MAAGKMLYKLRPKMHYMEHLLDEVEQWGGNPLQLANFTDEDHMKSLRSLALGCRPKKVKTSWAWRYVLKRVLRWRRLSQRPAK